MFNLQDQQGNDIRTNLISDENGQIIVNDLAPGDYQFVETKAPNGYELDTTPVKFTIVVGQTETVNIEKVNTASLGGVVLTKKDSKNGNLLEGAVFNLQDQQGNDI
ncbi:prealbumin-like fold domain-containing protein, partial [Clostridium perfringens]|uniref:prealbumin-like fold domain-containing protein n=1 Tax=Clostridium perfringens TaxID=1502 RepID=UPI0023B97421